MLSQSNSVQNLSGLTLKTKELWGGWKTSPMLHQPKKPSAYRVKRHNMTGNRTLSSDNVKDNCSKEIHGSQHCLGSFSQSKTKHRFEKVDD